MNPDLVVEALRRPGHREASASERVCGEGTGADRAGPPRQGGGLLRRLSPPGHLLGDQARPQAGRPGRLRDRGHRLLHAWPSGPAGYFQLKTLHSMGSGAGLANGFGKLERLGFDQPVLAVCGDSTFFHAAIPALVNGDLQRRQLHHAHPGQQRHGHDRLPAPPGHGKERHGRDDGRRRHRGAVPRPRVRVEVTDPFDLEGTTEKLLDLMARRRRRAGADIEEEVRPGAGPAGESGLPDARGQRAVPG